MVKKILLCLLVLACMALGIFAVAYTDPMLLHEFFPGAQIENCTEISGYYTDVPEHDDIFFSVTPDDECFAALRDCLTHQPFRRSLLPAAGTQTHAWQEGDFLWTATLHFDEPIPLPDGSTASGMLLRVDDFFGTITVHANGESWRCKPAYPQFRADAARYIKAHLNHLESED